MSRTKTLERPNAGKHIHEIVERTICIKHTAKLGEPCFKVRYDITPPNGQNAFGYAICGARAYADGFRGKITNTSLSRSEKPKHAKHSSPSSEKDAS